MVSAAVVAALVWNIVLARSWLISRFIVEVGVRCGQTETDGWGDYRVFVLGGPFQSGPGAEIWNWIYGHGPDIVQQFATIASGGITLVLTSGVLRRQRFQPREPTRCGSCQYELAGLTQPMCPECGHSIDHVQ